MSSSLSRKEGHVTDPRVLHNLRTTYRDLDIKRLAWKRRRVDGSLGRLASHSVLEISFDRPNNDPVRTTVRTEKFVEGITWTWGSTTDEVWKDTSEEGLIEPGWAWHMFFTEHLKVKHIVQFVGSSAHVHTYCLKTSNCHHFIQDIWNYCVKFAHRVWWRPDMLRTAMLPRKSHPDADWDDDWYDDHSEDDAGYSD
eukprot:TRINITY_DN67941_c0_g1_i1.p1 TRINITY_DN67941_c0_g1~~TRINITY_DN67941_c0_g1_i1.p1  ORF type:complete len:209 (+),score=13.00 TRINITY_DN67941_c0_g1_i1:41-628(+)